VPPNPSSFATGKALGTTVAHVTSTPWPNPSFDCPNMNSLPTRISCFNFPESVNTLLELSQASPLKFPCPRSTETCPVYWVVSTLKNAAPLHFPNSNPLPPPSCQKETLEYITRPLWNLVPSSASQKIPTAPPAPYDVFAPHTPAYQRQQKLAPPLLNCASIFILLGAEKRYGSPTNTLPIAGVASICFPLPPLDLTTHPRSERFSTPTPATKFLPQSSLPKILQRVLKDRGTHPNNSPPPPCPPPTVRL